MDELNYIYHITVFEKGKCFKDYFFINEKDKNNFIKNIEISENIEVVSSFYKNEKIYKKYKNIKEKLISKGAHPT